MIVKRQRTNKDGLQELTVVLARGESLMGIREDSHYQLGQPVDDVVGSHIILEAREVTWCSASQEWVS